MSSHVVDTQERLREMARVEAENYRSSTKKGKSQISRRLVGQMCELDPPARYDYDGFFGKMHDHFFLLSHFSTPGS